MDRGVLESAGVDVDEALERMMGSESLLERLLGKFLNDFGVEKAREAIARGDIKGAFEAIHATKGVSGNLSIKPVYQEASRFCDLVRAEDNDGAIACLDDLEIAVRNAKQAIERAI